MSTCWPCKTGHCDDCRSAEDSPCACLGRGHPNQYTRLQVEEDRAALNPQKKSRKMMMRHRTRSGYYEFREVVDVETDLL